MTSSNDIGAVVLGSKDAPTAGTNWVCSFVGLRAGRVYLSAGVRLYGIALDGVVFQ
jgi:hypothetical protein